MAFPREILIETKRIGAILRVAAVDPQSGIEIVFQAPASAPPETLHRLAHAKMRYALDKKK